MSTFLPAEKGSTIRVPSTANLMIDSADGPKDNAGIRINPWDFQITKQQAILNGFFTRIGTTEVVLEWNRPNLNADASNNWLKFDVSGAAGNPYTVFVNEGFYTVAQLLDALKIEMENDAPITVTINAAGTSPANLSYDNAGALPPGPAQLRFYPSVLAFQLGLGALPGGVVGDYVEENYLVNVDLRPYRYIDFVSSQLTYNQDIKDAATNATDRSVLCRWYFAWDTPPSLDAYNFPILMGYTAFFVRRIFSPPKQIRWESNMPIGNVAFQVYTNLNTILQTLPYDGKSNWLMTLQISEN